MEIAMVLISACLGLVLALVVKTKKTVDELDRYIRDTPMLVVPAARGKNTPHNEKAFGPSARERN